MRDEVIVVAGNRKKAALLSLGALAFVAGGAAMVDGGAKYGWAVLIFFGLCLLVSLYMLTPNAIRLTIDKHGIEMKTLFKPMKLAWSDIDGFYVASINTGSATTKMIGITYSPAYGQHRATRQFAAKLTGMEGGLPDHFSKSPEELCVLLNDAKQRWGDSAR